MLNFATSVVEGEECCRFCGSDIGFLLIMSP